MLSFAERLQLFQAVLFSFQVYWSSIFILTKKVINPVEQKLNAFLQKDKDAKIKVVEVAWEVLDLNKKKV